MIFVKPLITALSLVALLVRDVGSAESQSDTYIIKTMTVAELIQEREDTLKRREQLKESCGLAGQHLLPSQLQQAAYFDQKTMELRNEIQRLSARPPSDTINVRRPRPLDPPDLKAEDDRKRRIAASPKAEQINKLILDTKTLQQRSDRLLQNICAVESSARHAGILPIDDEMSAFSTEIEAVREGFEALDVCICFDDIVERDLWPSKTSDIETFGLCIARYNLLRERLAAHEGREFTINDKASGYNAGCQMRLLSESITRANQSSRQVSSPHDEQSNPKPDGREQSIDQTDNSSKRFNSDRWTLALIAFLGGGLLYHFSAVLASRVHKKRSVRTVAGR